MKQNPWEVTIDVWGQRAVWWWQVLRKRDSKGPRVRAWNRKPRKSRGAATAEARQTMKRLGLVEKAKAGKDIECRR